MKTPAFALPLTVSLGYLACWGCGNGPLVMSFKVPNSNSPLGGIGWQGTGAHIQRPPSNALWSIDSESHLLFCRGCLLPILHPCASWWLGFLCCSGVPYGFADSQRSGCPPPPWKNPILWANPVGAQVLPGLRGARRPGEDALGLCGTLGPDVAPSGLRSQRVGFPTNI